MVGLYQELFFDAVCEPVWGDIDGDLLFSQFIREVGGVTPFGKGRPTIQRLFNDHWSILEYVTFIEHLRVCLDAAVFYCLDGGGEVTLFF